jgi:hypothetical protein
MQRTNLHLKPAHRPTSCLRLLCPVLDLGAVRMSNPQLLYRRLPIKALHRASSGPMEDLANRPLRRCVELY